ncbi:hypothetical protein [Dactylosporangium darangshiense]|uniref:hypothetical protein n=1 Tax=Dactylosporangium darangshiense TaxID=579108 RepID=UPI00363329F9
MHQRRDGGEGEQRQRTEHAQQRLAEVLGGPDLPQQRPDGRDGGPQAQRDQEDRGRVALRGPQCSLLGVNVRHLH